ncbi:hypothetical protein GPECTOR_11g215 [Gonium pectorale]|uniref:Uncharacterized protein n=1 Tax=Gonium pectorale TaxID=33097 RepID=A0A150GPV4_GONPE|nr:hypothetical protein GPECTOR_11g215 [Gonium pectorale]|eukprot:KXZ51772.1 hypothetical protein GPECTOR_11g215 [Gonium pectorale]
MSLLGAGTASVAPHTQPPRALHHSANGAAPSQSPSCAASCAAAPRIGASFNRSTSMPPVRLGDQTQGLLCSPSSQERYSPGFRPRAWTMATEHELLSSLSSPSRVAGPPSAASISTRISSSSSSCSSSIQPSAQLSTQVSAQSRSTEVTVEKQRSSVVVRAARLLGRLLVFAYYAAGLLADVEAWREREARHVSTLAQQRRLHGEYDYGHQEHSVFALLGSPALWRRLTVLELMGSALPGGANGVSTAHLPVFPWLHVALALPCLVLLLFGLAAEPAALLLAARLLADLGRHHSRGLTLFWRGEHVQLLRLKELAVVGATLLAVARAAPGVAPTVAGADAAEVPSLDDVLVAETAQSSLSAASRLRGPQRQAWDSQRTRSTSSAGAAPVERSPPPSPVMQQLQAQLLRVQRQQQAERRRLWARRIFWACQRLLHRLGLALMVPLFAYYGCMQIGELQDVAEDGDGILAAVAELLTDVYSWVPGGDGAKETYWLPAQLIIAMPYFLGLGQQRLVLALAAAIGLEGALCWRFWARRGMMWSYAFHVWRHFMANAVIVVGLLSTLPAAALRQRERTLPLGGRKVK